MIYRLFDGRHVDLSKLVSLKGYRKNSTVYYIEMEFQLKDKPILVLWQPDFVGEGVEKNNNTKFNEIMIDLLNMWEKSNEGKP